MADRLFRFRLVLSTQQVLGFYQGQIKSVVVQADNGLRLQVDLLHFRQYFSHCGLDGYFELLIDGRGKFKALKKIN